MKTWTKEDDDTFFAEFTHTGSDGCHCILGIELHHQPGDVLSCCASTAVACGDCDAGAAEAEGADWP